MLSKPSTSSRPYPLRQKCSSREHIFLHKYGINTRDIEKGEKLEEYKILCPHFNIAPNFILNELCVLNHTNATAVTLKLMKTVHHLSAKVPFWQSNTKVKYC